MAELADARDSKDCGRLTHKATTSISQLHRCVAGQGRMNLFSSLQPQKCHIAQSCPIVLLGGRFDRFCGAGDHAAAVSTQPCLPEADYRQPKTRELSRHPTPAAARGRSRCRPPALPPGRATGVLRFFVNISRRARQCAGFTSSTCPNHQPVEQHPRAARCGLTEGLEGLPRLPIRPSRAFTHTRRRGAISLQQSFRRLLPSHKSGNDLFKIDLTAPIFGIWSWCAVPLTPARQRPGPARWPPSLTINANVYS